MAILMPEGKQGFVNSAGVPLVGGRLYTYDAGTSTPRPTYTDAAGTAPNTNPVILDARGEATVFWQGAYKVQLRDAADVVLWTVDNVRGLDPSDLSSSSDAAKGAGMVGFNAGLSYPAGSVGDAIKGAGANATVDDLTALRLQAKAANKRVTTRFYNAATPQFAGGGDYLCDLSDTTSPDNAGTVIVSADGGRWKLDVSGPALPARQCGVTGSGAVGESTKLMAADTMARTLKKNLYIEGTPLLDTQISINNPTSWEFAGHGASGGSNLMIPPSYLTTPAGAQPAGQSAVVVTTDGVQFHGGGIIAKTGFPHDGLTIGGYGFRWTGGPVFMRCGRDGVRVGSSTGELNCNGFYLDCPVFAYNGQHGINIDDSFGSIDANTFLITKPFSHHNTGHGIRLGYTYLGGTIVAPLCENNGVGMYFEPTASGIVIVGGDLEANDGATGGGSLQNLILAGNSRFTNSLLSTVVQGVIKANPLAFSGTWSPQVYGATFAGACTYTERKGVYSLSNGTLEAWIQVSWTGHGGTGQLYVSLPDLTGLSIDTTYGAAIPPFLQVSVAVAGLTLGASQTVAGLVTTNTIPPRVQLYLQTSGALASYAVPAAGTLYLKVSAPIFAFSPFP